MSVDELAGAIQAALAAIPTDTMHQVVSHLGEAEQVLAAAASGSIAPELPEAVQHLQHARENVARVTELLDSARSSMRRYLANLGVSNQVPAAASPPTSRPISAEPARPQPPRTTPEQIEAMRTGLPPTVPKPNPGRMKTHGKWRDKHGQVHELVSGEDADSTEAWERLQRAGMPPAMEPVNVTHVEMKLAVKMIRAGTKHIDLVINNRPCRGPYSCDSLLPVLLPAGYTITVHGPNYRKTFTGGMQWSR
ncbi:DddA-like double-stranded DNA deaminase toxin [Actinokineospora sp. HUAS TT18]|uniref:DddA-like double-stranded DNA deaminase toxin n=1 Tax=Actinokineospora sp. HUAS TT18 TaxID=3447451 RepID=UPI003F525538